MNFLLILANALAFMLMGLHPGAWHEQLALHPNHPTLTQFFGYQFMHAGAMHIIGNMLFLYIFGNSVNDKMGHLGYLAFYLAGGVIAGICYTLSETHGTPMVGASGAIAAVTGAYLILFPRSLVTVIYWFWLIGRAEIQSLWFIVAFFAMDVFGNFAQQDGVAHMAHIGGTIFGSSVCLLLVVTHLLPRDQFDVWALIQRWNKRRQYRDMVSKGYNPFDYGESMRGSIRKVDDPNALRVLDLRQQVQTAISSHDLPSAAELYVQMIQLDPTQLLSRQGQLDVANQLHHENRHAAAAEAYEKLLQGYPKLDQSEQIELIVGILYSRYLKQFDKARQHLEKAIARLHEGRQLDLAREELRDVAAQQSIAGA